LVVCTIRVGKMSYGLKKTLQCTVKIESGLGYKCFQVRIQVQVQQTVDLSPDSNPSPDSSTNKSGRHTNSHNYDLTCQNRDRDQTHKTKTEAETKLLQTEAKTEAAANWPRDRDEVSRPNIRKL